MYGIVSLPSAKIFAAHVIAVTDVSAVAGTRLGYSENRFSPCARDNKYFHACTGTCRNTIIILFTKKDPGRCDSRYFTSTGTRLYHSKNDKSS